HLIGARGEGRHALELTLIFQVEMATFLVTDNPYRSHGFARHIKWRQQAFLNGRLGGLQIGEKPLWTDKQLGAGSVQHGTARAEVPGSSAPYITLPGTSDGGLEKRSALIGLLEQAHAGRVRTTHLLQDQTQGLKNRMRRRGERARQGRESLVLESMVRHSIRTPRQFFGPRHFIERSGGLG